MWGITDSPRRHSPAGASAVQVALRFVYQTQDLRAIQQSSRAALKSLEFLLGQESSNRGVAVMEKLSGRADISKSVVMIYRSGHRLRAALIP